MENSQPVAMKILENRINPSDNAVTIQNNIVVISKDPRGKNRPRELKI